jgi:hypothetical protein
MREKDFQKKLQDKYKDELEVLRHEYNVLVVKHSKQTLEIKNLKAELE